VLFLKTKRLRRKKNTKKVNKKACSFFKAFLEEGAGKNWHLILIKR